jgi:hypothetical protein
MWIKGEMARNALFPKADARAKAEWLQDILFVILKDRV